jgi:hypothetical protein
MYEHSKAKETFHKSWKEEKRGKVEQRMRDFKPPSYFRISPNVYQQIQASNSESKMVEYSGKRLIPPIKCWGCKGENLYKYFPHKEDKIRIIHNLQESTTVEYVGGNIPRIYETLEDRQAEHQSHMIEVEGKTTNHPIVILIDSREIHIYIDPKLVDRFHLKKSNLEISCLVQLGTGTKRRINEVVRSCPIDMNGVNTVVYLNINMLVSCDILIGMYWLEKDHVFLDCHNKTFSCVDE